MVSKGWEEGSGRNGDCWLNRSGVSFGEDESALKLDGVLIAQYCEGTKCH